MPSPLKPHWNRTETALMQPARRRKESGGGEREGEGGSGAPSRVYVLYLSDGKYLP